LNFSVTVAELEGVAARRWMEPLWLTMRRLPFRSGQPIDVLPP
jgi:hypothetical protein